MDNVEWVFRKIEKEEFDKLHALFPDGEEMWAYYREMRLKELDEKELTIYVIEREKRFIGELSVHRLSHQLALETIPGQRVYLQTFRVEPAYQGFGLGQRLLEFVLSDLEKQGYREFTIGVEEDNKRAKHIYFKFGFTKAIDKGHGDELDPTDYTLYLRSKTTGEIK